MVQQRKFPKNFLKFFDYTQAHDDMIDDFFYYKEKINYQKPPKKDYYYRDYIKNYGIQI